MGSSTVQLQYVCKTNSHTSSNISGTSFLKGEYVTRQNSHTLLGQLWPYGDEEHGNWWFKILHSRFN